MDAIPLVLQPTLAEYTALAEELRDVRADGSDAVADWARRWLDRLATTRAGALGHEIRATIERAAFHIEQLVRSQAATPRSLAGAEEVLARLHGFDGWLAFASHLQGLMETGSATARFEAAADAVVDGELAALQTAVAHDPALIRATSQRRHHSTLLHYVAANGIEDFRQRTPSNIVEVTRFLLAAGAEVDAPNADYAGGGSALGLVATSIHPYNAGLQIQLMEILVAAGANLEGLPGGWRPVDAALANGCPEAAGWLADRGARLTIISAAALGRMERLEAELEGATRAEIEEAFVLACGYGHTRAAEVLLDHGVDIEAGDGRAMRLALEYGHDATVAMLRERGAATRRR